MATGGIVLLKIGVEGGESTIFRTPIADSGWQYHVAGGSMFLDENDNEAWSSGTSKSFPTFEAALQSIAADGTWVTYYPLEVHPDYRMIVWNLAQSIVPMLPEEFRDIWYQHSGDNWKRVCLTTN